MHQRTIPHQLLFGSFSWFLSSRCGLVAGPGAKVRARMPFNYSLGQDCPDAAGWPYPSPPSPPPPPPLPLLSPRPPQREALREFSGVQLRFARDCA